MAATIIITASYLLTAKDDSVRFEQQYGSFIDMQNKALAPLKASLDDSTLKQQLQAISLPEWEKAQQVIQATSVYKLNDAFTKKRQLATQYAQMRIDQTNLLLKALEEKNVEKYQPQIDESGKAINAIVEEMNKQ